tara:strand:- start:68 stop:616 length:549 start_codon:yes stop_codon:yes gene_type:complete
MATWDLLSTATVAGSSTQTISFTSINQNYKDLCIMALVKDNLTASHGQSGMQIAPKTAAGGAMALGMGYMSMGWNQTTPTSYQYGSGQTQISTYIANNASGYNGVSPQYMYFYDYSSTTVAKNMYLFNGIIGENAQNANNTFQMWRSLINDASNNPVGRIDITSQSGYFLAGCVASLYGIEG